MIVSLLSNVFLPLSVVIIMFGMGLPTGAYSIWMFITGVILIWQLEKRKVVVAHFIKSIK